MATQVHKMSRTSAEVMGSVLTLLRLEGLAVAAVSAVLYARTGASWWLFAVLWLTPDLSMLGYLVNSCWGARSYNTAHTYVVPGVLAMSALLLDALCAHLDQSHRGGSADGVWAEILRWVRVDAPWSTWQARRYLAGSELISTPGMKARTTSDTPKRIRMMRPASSRS